MAADWVAPVDTGKQAVIFTHGFLDDRSGHGWFDSFGKAYRRAGYATLMLDFSGCGKSDDDTISCAAQAEDLMAVSSWVAKQGFTDQIIHAHGFGATVALTSDPQNVRGYILCAPLLGPVEIAWEEVFSEQQLTELELHGTTRIPNDLAAAREYTFISKQTLRDISTVDGSKLLENITKPLLFVADDVTLEAQWFAPILENPQILLPDYSQLLVRKDVSFDLPFPVDTPHFGEELRNLTITWMAKNFPVVK